MITEERREYLLWAWSEETNDPETEEWREELTPEEEELVKGWDKGYESGLAQLCGRMEAQRNEQ